MAGRQTKLTPEIQEKICSLIRDGNYQNVACEAAGIGVSTFHGWLDKGKGETARSPYKEFLEAVTQAERDSETQLVQYWRNAAEEDWRAAKELLARRHADRWSEQKKLELSGGLTLTESVRTIATAAGLTDEEIAEAEQIAKELG